MSTSFDLRHQILYAYIIIVMSRFPEILGQENEILSIFSPCYTDLIFSNNVRDIAPPEYPILVSTPQDHMSVTPKTVRENENLISISINTSYMPMFRSVNENNPHLIKLRFKCVALILLEAQTKTDVLSSARNRHNWIHSTDYNMGEPEGETDMKRRRSFRFDLNDTLHYTGPIYINLVGNAGFEDDLLNSSPWLFSRHGARMMWSMYFWTVCVPDLQSTKVLLSIRLFPICGILFEGTIAPEHLSVAKLESLHISNLQANCQKVQIWGYQEDKYTDEDIGYYGPPVQPSTLIFPRTAQDQFLFRSVPIFIVVSPLPNVTIFAVANQFNKVYVKHANKFAGNLPNTLYFMERDAGICTPPQ